MFSATDISTFLGCQHTATLKRAESRKEITRPFFADATVDLLRKLGLEHEQRYLQMLIEGKLSVEEIEAAGPWAPAIAQTIEAHSENRSPERMGKGELYEYYKRIGMLEVYFALFPGS